MFFLKAFIFTADDFVQFITKSPLCQAMKSNFWKILREDAMVWKICRILGEVA
jgi:hypothetical protein